jgi:hypothetical protein
MTATATLHRPRSAAAGIFNEVTGRTELPAPTLLYSGPAVIQPADREAASEEVGGRDVTSSRYSVGLVLFGSELDPAVGDLLTVTAHPAHPELVGARLWVMSMARSSLAWTWTLTCTSTPPVNR